MLVLHPFGNFHVYLQKICEPTLEDAKLIEQLLPFWIYTVCKIVSHIVMVANYGIIRRRATSLSQVSKEIGGIKYINIIVRSGHAKKSMPYPQVVGGDNFEQDSQSVDMTSIHSVICCWTVFPHLMHTVQTPQHSRKATLISFT